MTTSDTERLEFLRERIIIYSGIYSLKKRGKPHRDIYTIIKLTIPNLYKDVISFEEYKILNKIIRESDVSSETTEKLKKIIDTNQFLNTMMAFEDYLSNLGIDSVINYEKIIEDFKEISENQNGALYSYQKRDLKNEFCVEPARILLEKTEGRLKETKIEFDIVHKKVHGHPFSHKNVEKVIQIMNKIERIKENIESIKAKIDKERQSGENSHSTEITKKYSLLNKEVRIQPMLIDSFSRVPSEELDAAMLERKLNNCNSHHDKLHDVPLKKLSYYLKNKGDMELLVGYVKSLRELEKFKKEFDRRPEIIQLQKKIKELENDKKKLDGEIDTLLDDNKRLS